MKNKIKNFLKILTTSGLILLFSFGCGEPSFSDNTGQAEVKPYQNADKPGLSVKDLMRRFTGNWENSDGAAMLVTENQIDLTAVFSGAGTVKYEIKGIEGVLPDAIRIEFSTSGMTVEGVAAFEDENNMTFGIIGNMPARFRRK
jgi:hypothetical protein